LGLDAQQRVFDGMTAGDERPRPLGESGGRLEVGRLVTPRWAVSVSGHFGGGWLDYLDYIDNYAGKIEDVGWGVRAGVDRHADVGSRSMLFFGGGLEYTESRSWLRNYGFYNDILDEGPRCYATGGFVRAGGAAPVWRRLWVAGQVSTSLYGAHAVDPPIQTRYNWLGRSFSASVGLRLHIGRERP
jgi:hypothetical protein